ncbi:hypothetical protein [Nocardia niwae]|uniref:hypothetical protein n=1 Tax=Nocardia niwae TaxID=626084 RepID=UPI000AEA14D1|nr:hypothetical protein [Nocardia niwae]
MTESNRRGADRRLTFTQDPFTAKYAEELAERTGLSKGALYNQSMRVLAVLVGAHRRGTEYVVRNAKTGRTHHDPGLSVLLGDILATLPEHPPSGD